MSDSNDESGGQAVFNLYDPFFDTYLETLEVLHALGIEFSFKQRIPIFKVYTHLSELERTDEIAYAMDMLDELKALMQRGLEPSHVENTYE